MGEGRSIDMTTESGRGYLRSMIDHAPRLSSRTDVPDPLSDFWRSVVENLLVIVEQLQRKEAPMTTSPPAPIGRCQREADGGHLEPHPHTDSCWSWREGLDNPFGPPALGTPEMGTCEDDPFYPHERHGGCVNWRRPPAPDRHSAAAIVWPKGRPPRGCTVARALAEWARQQSVTLHGGATAGQVDVTSERWLPSVASRGLGRSRRR